MMVIDVNHGKIGFEQSKHMDNIGKGWKRHFRNMSFQISGMVV